MEKSQNIFLIGAIISHYLLVCADLYAQTSITPVALSAPPASFSMYQGEYVYNPVPFWQTTNMVALVFLVAALALNWQTSRRKLLLSTLIGTIAISIVSVSYIFPEYTAIVSSEYSTTIDPELSDRASTWQAIAFFRLILFGCLGLLPLSALSKPTT